MADVGTHGASTRLSGRPYARVDMLRRLSPAPSLRHDSSESRKSASTPAAKRHAQNNQDLPDRENYAVPIMDLLEREPLLDRLAGLLGDALAGSGAMAFVAGEAGVGKSSLVRRFCDGLGAGVRTLWGACDPLSAPPPLGALRDMASRDRRLTSLFDASGDRHDLFSRILTGLQHPTVMVIEDVHWADDATLDLLRYLGRRVTTTRSLVVVTFREDELSADHVLRPVLGDVATADGCHRLQVPPLSLTAVAELAHGRPLDPDRLHRMTGGNPFFVTEVLAAPSWTVPPTVADAVLARARSLTAPARRLLDLVSTSPRGLEVSLLAGLLDDAATRLDECVTWGVLLVVDGIAMFRHELARLAVYDAAPAGQCFDDHLNLLTALERDARTDPARLAHHADAVGDHERVLRYAPVAGDEASCRGAHRSAADQYGRAVAMAERHEPAQLAPLMERWVDERRSVDPPDTQVELRTRPVDLWRRAGDHRRAGEALVHLSGVVWESGRCDDAGRLAAEAVHTLEELGPGPELAAAYAERGRIAMLARDAPEALRWGTRAIDLGTRVGASWALMHALNTVGSTRIVADADVTGVGDLTRSLELALAAGDDRGASLALSNLGSGLAEIRAYQLARHHLQDAVTFARDRDMDATAGYATAWLARISVEQGRWTEAAEHAEAALGYRHCAVIVPIVALTAQGRLRTRRGDRDADAPLAEAWDLAEATGELQRLWPVAAARAEAAWLRGEGETIPELVGSTFQLATDLGVGWAIGDLAYWLWRAGVLDEPPGGAARPFALQMAGDWTEAAGAWAELGCPYEQADALAGGDEPAMRQALDSFIRLGAEPAADRLRHQLRELGAYDIPARPRASTRTAPGQLTRRQLEVLALVAKGCSDADIAERLFISPKTAGHHVSAILRTLGVRSRTEAAAAARQLGR